MRIDVVAFEDPKGNWIAQGIQYDIVARAHSVGGLREAFHRQVLANLRLNAQLGREGLEGIPPSPQHFKSLFDEAKEQLTPLAALPPVRQELDIRVAEAA
jgi:hypothetical protein